MEYRRINNRLIKKTKEEWAAIDEANEPVKDYAELRRNCYPDKGDQLDAIWKQFKQWKEDEKLVLIQEADDMLLDILAVKNKYPKH